MQAELVRQPPPAPPPPMQASLRTPCPALPPPASDTMLALIANHDQVTAQYHDCAARNAALVRAADEWQGTAWRWYCQAVQAAGLRTDDACKDKTP